MHVNGRGDASKGYASRRRRVSSQLLRYSKVLIAAGLVLAIVIYYRSNVRGLRWYQWPYKFSDKFVSMPCPRPRAQLQAIENLVHIAHEVFTSLGIVYSLSYGTLFGALRYGGPVPWDADADLIILKNTIDKYSLPELQKAFSKSGVKIQWFGYGGFYLLSKNNATCDCFLFSDFYGSGWLHRVGWESYIFFINYRWHHMFPAALLEKPLPTLKFGGKDMFAPHGLYEIQKYHYRDDWRTEIRPPNCPKNSSTHWLYPPPTEATVAN